MTGAVLAALSDRVLELGPLRDEDNKWANWHLSRDVAGIAWLLIDCSGESVNTLSQKVLAELEGILSALEKNPPKALVIRSAKKSGFIAGADINEFKGAIDPSAVATQMKEAHRVVDRLAALQFPTIAVIHGFCLGGGLEITLACKYRIAIEGASFGFPEVVLGLHPGLGGTARLTHLIDPIKAMTMMLTGKPVQAPEARKLGIVAAVTQERHVRKAVEAAVTGDLRSPSPGLHNLLMNAGPVRHVAAGMMRRKTAKSAPRDHYPAPYALIDLWAARGGQVAAMLTGEKTSFSHLVTTETSQNLVRVFALREQLKKFVVGNPHVHHLHVIGAGAMGGDIAAWCAHKGLTVTLADMKAEAIGKAIKRASDLFGKIAHNHTERRAALDRLIPDLRGDGVRRADLVIEAVPERLEIKRKVYESVAPHLKPGAVLATNTSSIPLEDLRRVVKEPGRFVGLHFFNPVSRMQLIEIVRHNKVDKSTLELARGFVGQIDRLPAPVKSAPGFLVNRVLTPYVIEAMLMIGEGVARETVDLAAEKFGMPMGPVQLADRLGLDICLDVADLLKKNVAQTMPDIPAWLRKSVETGDLGKKTGKGLYEWKDGKAAKKGRALAPTTQMTERLILPMLNACVACLREGTVSDPDIVDGAIVFATGFAPFRGGPLHYARQRGVASVVSALQSLAKEFGKRFDPDSGWDRLPPAA